MTDHSQMPLVGPSKRRGWREIVRFRQLTSATHVALVVTRRGHVASIIPANSQRALSDYLSWPYDFHEVDTCERLLELDQRLESCDAEHEFAVSLRLIYQVTRPDRVALDREDVLVELTQALLQSLRQTGRSMGVEQAKVFEEQLGDMLLYNAALVQRVQELGLVLRRADVTVALDERARAFAEELRLALRERPLHFQVTVESLETERSFDVHVGGAYRMIDRQAKQAPSAETEAAVQLAVARTLRRIGITFIPNDYPSAASAMAEALRKDALLRVELAVAQVELLRPTVQIQPDRSMVHIPQPNAPTLVDVQAETALTRSPQWRLRAGSHQRALPPPSEELILSGEVLSNDDDAPPWAGLASASGRALPLPSEPPSVTGEVLSKADDAPRWPERAPAFPRALLPPGKPAVAASEATSETDDVPPWAGLMAAFPQAQPSDAPLISHGDPADQMAWVGSADVGEQNGFFTTTHGSATDSDVSNDSGAMPTWASFAGASDTPASPAEPAAWYDTGAGELAGTPTWTGFADGPSAPVPDEIGEQPSAENETPALFEADEPSPFELAIRKVSDLLSDQPDQAAQAELPELGANPTPDDHNTNGFVHADLAGGALDEQIAYSITLLRSQGPAWFKMWVLELQEQPARLPQILAEVTANTDLLNQADDPRYQDKLLQALAAEPPPTSPPRQPVVIPALEPEPDEQADMPDWLRLRSKWNGNGGSS